jgi:hypothetical protein
MPKQINTATVGQRLVQLFNLKGRFQPVLDEVIVPVVSVDAETVQQRPASGGSYQAGAAAQYSFGLLSNPNDSGKIIRVSRIHCWSSNPGNFFTTIRGALYTLGVINTADVEFTDGGQAGAPVGFVQTGVSTTLVTFITGAVRSAPNAGPQLTVIDGQWILPSGTGLMCMFSTVLSDSEFSFQWTEEDLITRK